MLWAIGLAPIAIGGLGVYPVITGLLSPEEAPAHQAQLQGALKAVCTAGSLVALCVYYALFDATATESDGDNTGFIDGGAIWVLSAGLTLVSAVCAYAAGEPAPPSGGMSAGLV